MEPNVNKLLSFDNQGHWMSESAMDYKKYFGFLYLVKNIPLEKYYIGMKQYKREGKKRNKFYGRESNWKTYTGSSSSLKEDITKMGIENFSFICLKEYHTRGGLKYGEANLQHKLDVLVAVNNSGERLFYNNSIEMIRYIPKEYYNLTTRKVIDNEASH